MNEADVSLVKGWNFTLFWKSLLRLFEYSLPVISADDMLLGESLCLYNFLLLIRFFLPEEVFSDGSFPPSFHPLFELDSLPFESTVLSLDLLDLFFFIFEGSPCPTTR